MKSHFRILNCIRLIKFFLRESFHLYNTSEENQNIFTGGVFFLFVIISGIICKLHFLRIILRLGHYNGLLYIFIYSTSKQSVWF